ncbi:phosphatidylinositol 4-phosphate 5-kinase-like protein 1 [Haliotis cracherodii]|uniref:phosphatidylinositol 4-phosphate 5-kinase-like protein 1 n=1 Tax=Haliotis cracherodii TaxID=6455 RepID=UPI0039EB2730
MSIELHEIGASASTSPNPQQAELKSRSSAWQRLQKRLKRKGVVEVDIDHHRYDMLNCIRTGIRHVLLNHPELGPKESLEAEDYKHVLEKKVEGPDGQVFVFASYASSAFAAIRRAIGLRQDFYLESVAPAKLPYLEFVSNSKSGQDFFLSNDQQYLLKTDRKYCIDFFLSTLGDYLQHFLKFPHSLIVKYLGLYSIQMPGERKKYFVVMQSIFYPSHRIETRFDIKGALAGRYQQPYPPGSNIVTVLKDQNFLNEVIDLGPQREWFITQLKADTEFLKEMAVQDYSLLIGRQELHTDERRETLPNLVERLKKSLPSTASSSSDNSSPEHHNGNVEGGGIEMHSLPGTPNDDTKTSVAEKSPERKTGVFFPLSLTETSYLDGLMTTENRRLLPNCKNALHIIDGPTHRYFLGVIDFFTLYEYRQRTGRIYKNIKYCCADHSTVPPGEYGDRFLRFIIEHVK